MTMERGPKRGARVWDWIATIALVALAGPGTVRAAGIQAALMPSQQTVSPGAEFDLEIDVTAAGSPFNAFKAVVTYDPAALTFMQASPVSAQQGCLMTGACSAACGTTFHTFSALADSLVMYSSLLCDAIALTGPGQVYKLHFQASNTQQVTYVRFRRPPTFLNAGLYVFPVTAGDAVVGIGSLLGVDAGGTAGKGLRVRAEPNPSPGAVMLTVESDAAGEQRLDVLDVQGRLVRRLAGGWYQRGIRQVPWDGRDASGARSPAGVYLIRLQAGGRATRAHVTLLN
jgi:hypothetical protein